MNVGDVLVIDEDKILSKSNPKYANA